MYEYTSRSEFKPWSRASSRLMVESPAGGCVRREEVQALA